jgi:hypothetical protein
MRLASLTPIAMVAHSKFSSGFLRGLVGGYGGYIIIYIESGREFNEVTKGSTSLSLKLTVMDILIIFHRGWMHVPVWCRRMGHLVRVVL